MVETCCGKDMIQKEYKGYGVNAKWKVCSICIELVTRCLECKKLQECEVNVSL